MIKRIRNKFSEYGIGIRMAVYFVGIVILPFIFLAFILFYSFQSYTADNLSSTTQDTMTAIKSELDTLLKQYEDLTMTLYYGGYVDQLSVDTETSEIIGVLDGICFPNTHIHAIYLETQEQVYHSGAIYEELFDVMGPYRDEIRAAGGKCIWYPTDGLRGNALEKQYILARQLNNSENESVGILYFVLDERFISKIYSQLTSGYAEKYLTDTQGHILYSTGVDEPGHWLDITELSTSVRNGTVKAMIQGVPSSVVYSRLSSADWYCISVIPDSEIIRDICRLELPFILIALIYLLFLGIMLYMLRKNIFRPLKTLKKAMDEYALNGLEPVRLEPFGSGEFRSLSGHFSKMMDRICLLINQYEEETNEKNRQRMKTLTAQLSPHFIYNSLNTIKWMAVLNKQKNIQNLIESLICIFRNAARVDDDTYTVKDELDLVKNYAVIQKARFMNFDLKIEADESCMQCKIRKFLLQPVVENAIVHGLGRGQEKDGLILLRVKVIEGVMQITVSDNGVGFDVKKWRSQPDVEEDHTNIGLHNVEEIIRLEYREPYSFDIQSEPGKGTTVQYMLPLIKG